MSADEALRAAEAAGVMVAVDGDGLLLEAPAEPPPTVLDALSRNKYAIVALLRPAQDQEAAKRRQARFEQRSRVMAADRGLSRTEAEALAQSYCLVEWLDRQPSNSTPGRCAWCGRAESLGAAVIPFGARPGTHAWLHPECWSAWRTARRAEATAALRTIGIPV